MAYDKSWMFAVVRNDLSAEASNDYHFAMDASTSSRLKAAVAMAIPDPDKAIWKLSVTAQQQASASKRTDRAGPEPGRSGRPAGGASNRLLTWGKPP